MFYGDVNTPLPNATVAMIFLDLKSFIIEKLVQYLHIGRFPLKKNLIDLEKGKDLTGKKLYFLLKMIIDDIETKCLIFL